MFCKAWIGRVSPRGVSPGGLAIGLVLALGTSACTAYPTFSASAPVDCTAQDRVDVSVIDDGDADGTFFGSPDNLGTAPTPMSELIGDGGRCGSSKARVYRAQHCNDWGAVFGFNNFRKQDKSAFEGLAFWARVGVVSARSFSIVLADLNTAPVDEQADGVHESNCVKYVGPADGTTSTGSQNGTVADNSSMVNGRQPAPNECGNDYSTVLEVTPTWTFYTVPFAAFHQKAQPNRVPNAELTHVGNVPGTGLLTSALRGLVLRAPRGETLELWIDDLGFYTAGPSANPADASTDGSSNNGTDARADTAFDSGTDASTDTSSDSGADLGAEGQ